MTQSRKGCSWQLSLANYLVSAGALVFGNGLFLMGFTFANYAFAQSAITPDNTLETPSRVEKDSTDDSFDVLKGGVTRQNNLFHSFQEFNVDEGQTALFLSPSSNIQNILVRVTGTTSSEILGTLRTAEIVNNMRVPSNANLFLINPNGIIFGANARLRLNGSFVATTANSIKFTDGIFSGNSPPTTPLLKVSVPIGLQFTGSAGEIKINGEVDGSGFLRVQAGKTLALVGGNIRFDGGGGKQPFQLLASSGQIALGGILKAGTIELNLDSDKQILTFPNNVALADVLLSNRAVVSSSGSGGGYIQVQGRRIMLTDESQVVAETQGNQNGRDIFIQAEQFTIKDASQVRTTTGKDTTGSGGSLIVKATDFVQISGTNADGKASALFANTSGEGSAGKLTIKTGQLIVENGGQIAASALLNSRGHGGDLEITADFIKLSGSPVPDSPSGLFAQTYGSNDAGSLTINTRQLIVQDGAQIVAGTQPSSQGNGGTLTIKDSELIELSGKAPNGKPSGLFARSLGSGNAGSVFITTRQLNVRDQAEVTVSALQGGNAGNLDVQADEIRLDEGKLLAQTALGNGGDINLQVQNLLQLRNYSQISTSAGINKVGGGNGGDINIKTPDGFIVAVPGENSDISANAFGGKGGNVDIKAFGIYGTQPRKKPTQFSDITASSQVGLNGVIRITTPDVNPNERLINLPTQLVQPKLAQVCKASVGRNQNSFTITGRGGVPSNPTEPLSADAVLADWITLDKVSESASNQNVSNANIPTQANPEAVVEANGWEINAKGEVVLIANASSVTPHTYWQQSTDCDVAQASS